ncbi:serine/threonine-protein kinase MRCK alpha isoform X1 [Gracilaria domingensis]|nr:serine/threonine-protein kinase MRCK alpha isoform X1 [Gracilaria domingensis]
MSSSWSPDTSQSLSSPSPRPLDLDDTQRKLYLHHEHVVNEYNGSDTLYRDAVLLAKASARSAKHATETADRLRRTEKSVKENLEQLNKQHMRKVLLPRTMREKIHKVQMELEGVTQEFTDAERVANSAQRKALADMKSCIRLREGAHKLRESERTRRQILDGLFDGLHIGSPEENRVESERDALVLATNRKKDSLTAQRQAYQLLASALVDVKQAKKELWDARIKNTVDMFNGGGVGFVAGMQSRIRFNAASEKSKEAATKIGQVVALNPKLPVRKVLKSKSKEKTSLGLGELFFDGIVTDMLARMAIDKAEEAIERLEEECEASITLQKATVAQLREEYAASAAELEGISKELVRIRVELIHDALL